jgi:hypothetical protein
MKTPLRAASIAAAGAAALVAAFFTAAPATAAPSGLTEASCTAQGGVGNSTFTRVKGVKTCVVVAGTIRYVSDGVRYNNQPGTSTYGSTAPTSCFEAPFLCVSWTEQRGYKDITTSTQKGGGAVVVTTTELLVLRNNFEVVACGMYDGNGIQGLELVYCYNSVPPEYMLP